MRVQLKRLYDETNEGDGHRALVDGMWPRGVAKADASIDAWYRDLAPSKSRREWFGHDRDRWEKFYAAYREELRRADSRLTQTLREHAQNGGGNAGLRGKRRGVQQRRGTARLPQASLSASARRVGRLGSVAIKT